MQAVAQPSCLRPKGSLSRNSHPTDSKSPLRSLGFAAPTGSFSGVSDAGYDAVDLLNAPFGNRLELLVVRGDGHGTFIAITPIPLDVSLPKRFFRAAVDDL